jgi:L,D-transpeptidase YcbB
MCRLKRLEERFDRLIGRKTNVTIRSPNLALLGALSMFAAPQIASAQTVPPPPTSILPPVIGPAPTPSPSPSAPPLIVPPALTQPVLVAHWSVADATALLGSILRIGDRGLFSVDYGPAELKLAIADNEGLALDEIASRTFVKLASDLRDGRTPKSARIQWLVRDTDAVTNPMDALLQKAVTTHNIEGVLASLDPEDGDYAKLKVALASAKDAASQRLIRTNMDRWRWLPRSLGAKHLLANVPEYMLRVVTYDKVIATYRVIIGKQDTQTPSLMAPATGIVVHPPWTIPRSLIVQEVGPMIARNPAAARARGYTWTGTGPSLSVVQQPGPNAALGFMKIDMPNPDAIFIHDTPNRGLFARHPRAFSHGCLRTDRALELGILLGILQTGAEAEDLATLIKKGKTERVPFKESIPVVIGYFTLATGDSGNLQPFPDVYGRDVAVAASFDKPRVDKPIFPAFKPPVVPATPVVPQEVAQVRATQL